METIDNKDSVLKLSLLALAIVAVTGCSSGGSSSQPIDQDDPGQTDGGGGSSDSGGSSGDSGGGSGDGGGSSDPSQDFTYKTINPANPIDNAAGEIIHLESVSMNATSSSSGVAINKGPEISFEAILMALEDAPDGKARIGLIAPAAGVDEDFSESDKYPYDFDNGENEVKILSLDDEGNEFLDGSLNYAAYGNWLIRNSSGDSDGGFFAWGSDTRSSDMPTSGTASYSGVTQGEVIINNGQAHALIGQATLDVNFTSKDIEGTLTNMTAQEYDSDVVRQWHDIDLIGGLDSQGNRFGGITQVESSPGNAASISNDSRGGFNGRFYGPGAAEAAGVWSIEDPNGSAAYGAFGVKKD
ncbi:transferrin-binding protein-like solute binding protein [Vreelandella alkaliphila]|uniref:Transferrin-binding protein B C-lobe/N-lobe beta-barrel domain-containing protein n=1 Tax=Vreelandella alkaliphila TaxID=272774 RepID=A0ABX4HMH5_9GAMM|nr:transferrin-binding protein-like solute binding protein [Halomonas humidisoli]PAU73702.1 hypothetical protein CK497_03595 [Halomonas humidisoli]